jgi:RND family efflux transporter MFP subunit
MELVPATSGSSTADSRSIQIDPVARRIANIQTVAVVSMPMTRTIRAVGELDYDEGTLKTISAYVDGRIDQLYADYTGVVVEKGDRLALVYSPRLFSSQVELLLARKSRKEISSASIESVVQITQDLYDSARQRLVGLGMTEVQIAELEELGTASSRMHLCAPISGTVIKKFAVEGQYVKEGQAIYELADLSTVWLILKLFPEDAAIISKGQLVTAMVQSLPGRTFTGQVAFIDTRVRPETRTVDVRVVISNEEGLLRSGDYASATIDVPIMRSGSMGKIANPEMDNNKVLVIPHDAVLMAGNHSVVYAEVEPGRFEIRNVVLGPVCNDQIVILSGLKEGEQVATRGNFLIDSQMQLAGNPSLIDPEKTQRVNSPMKDDGSAEVIAALSKLSSQDRGVAERQGICPVTMMPLGSMGKPPKVDVNGTPVFICCEGCRGSLLEEPDKYLAILTSRSGERVATKMDLPPIDMPVLFGPEGDLPPIETPQLIEDIERVTDRQARPVEVVR